MIMDGNILMVKLVLKLFVQVAVEKDSIKLSWVPQRETTSTIATNGSTNSLTLIIIAIFV